MYHVYCCIIYLVDMIVSNKESLFFKLIFFICFFSPYEYFRKINLSF